MNKTQQQSANVTYFNNKYRNYRFINRDNFCKFKLEFFNQDHLMKCRLISYDRAIKAISPVSLHVWDNDATLSLEPKINSVINKLSYDYVMEINQ